MVYQVSDLELVHSTVLDVSPAILIPHYDEDSSTLFINSKVRLFDKQIQAAAAAGF